MKTTARVAQMIIRVTGVLLIILGILFWIGRATRFVPIHMLLGIILVLALWALAVVAGLNRVGVGLAVTSIIWGLIVVVLGLTQRQILPGSSHWIIQVIHLLLGLGAIGLGEALGGRIKRRRTRTAVGA